MMDTSLSFHPEKNQRLFVFSGIPAQLEKSLLQKIESLHGKAVYPVKDTAARCCTHVIAQEFATTEKILGALAGGKWLLATTYVHDSYKEGRWLKEEGYELTDLNEVARYHRRQRMVKGYGVYEGWKILVLLEPPPYSRKFKRILTSGGAEVALQSDVSDIDFVLTTKEMLGNAKEKVDSVLPLVDVSYIKNTLLYKHDPHDLRKYDMRYRQEFKPSKKSGRRSPLIGSKKASSKNSCKRPADESLPGKEKKSCSHLKQISLKQFVQPSVKKSSSNNIISEGRQCAPEKTVISVNRYASDSRHSDNSLSSASFVIDVGDDSQNEHGLESNYNNKIQEARRKASENFTLVNTLESTPMVHKLLEDTHHQDRQNSNDISDTHQIQKNTFEDRTPMDTSPVKKAVDENKQNQNRVKSSYISKTRHNKEDTSKGVAHMDTSSCVNSESINTHNVKLKDLHICLGKKITSIVDANCNEKYHSPKSKSSHSEPVKKIEELLKRQSLKGVAAEPTKNKSVVHDSAEPAKNKSVVHDSAEPTKNKSVVHASAEPTKNKSVVHDSVEPTKNKSVKYISAEPTKNKSVVHDSAEPTRNKSVVHDSVYKQVQYHKEASSKPPIYTATKMQIWKAIVQFLRTRNHLNGICSTSTLSIPRGREYFPNSTKKSHNAEVDLQEALDEPNYQDVIYEHRELTIRELHFYICCTDEDTASDKEHLVNGIDTLLLQLSTYLYPPPNIFGNLLKNFVVETQLSMVHSRALRVAYMLLSLHPPVTAKMRAYYLSALGHANMPDGFGSYIPWKFVQRVIQLASCMESAEEPCLNQDMEEEFVDKATRALHLLEFIVLLLTEDVRHSKYGEEVKDLLTWQIFCGSSKSYVSLTSPVKELLHLWMLKRITIPALKWHLSQLVSVVLEVLWKFSGQPLTPVDILPTSLDAVQWEMKINLKDLNCTEHLEMIWRLPTPWAQAVVTFIIVQECAQCPKRISLPYIMQYFKSSNKERSSNQVPEAGRERKGLSNTNSDLVIERKGNKELFLTLASCYLEASGYRYVTLIIKKCIGEMAKKNTRERKEKTFGSFPSSNTENSDQKSDEKKNSETKKHKHMSHYLNLVEDDCLQDLSELEEHAILKMYSCFKQDRDIPKKWFKHNASLVTRKDLRYFFKTLCL